MKFLKKASVAAVPVGVPILLSIKNVPILSQGEDFGEADVATIPAPAGISRYIMRTTGAINGDTGIGGVFVAKTAPGGGGSYIMDEGGPNSAIALVGDWAPVDPSFIYSAGPIYVRQIADCDLPGNCSFFIWIWPID